MPTIQGSTVIRRQLGRRLRRLREAANKSDRDVTESGICSRATLWRVESGQSSIKVGTVRALCWLYSAEQTETDALATLAMATTGQGWWHDYGTIVPAWFNLYVGLESAATEIRIYEPELVHGLLQSPGYLRAVFREGINQIDEVAIQRQTKLRQERQQAITIRTPPLRVTTVFSAGVLARRVGDKAVMKEQISRLHELNQLDHVDIRVVPWDAGGHAAMHVGGFAILDFADADDPPVVYLESHTGARYLEKDDELADYRKIHESVYRKSIPIEEFR